MIERALSWAFRAGLRKGVVDGRGGWLVLGAAAGAIRFLRRPDKNAGGSIQLKLKPGERYEITCSEDLTVR